MYQFSIAISFSKNKQMNEVFYNGSPKNIGFSQLISQFKAFYTYMSLIFADSLHKK